LVDTASDARGNYALDPWRGRFNEVPVLIVE